MKEFIIGLSSTLSGAIIAYLFRYNIENLINSIFRNIYANIDGVWEIYGYWREQDSLLDLDKEKILEILKEEEYTDEEVEEIMNEKEFYDETKIPKDISDEDLIQSLQEDDCHVIMNVTQIANKVSGEVNTIIKGISKRKQKIQGRITPSRIIIFNSEDKSEGHHNFGTYLLKLSLTSDIMKGFETYICSECEDTAYSNVILKKVKKQNSH